MITVTTNANELDQIASTGAGVSLAEAIRDIASGGVITFAPSLSGQTITLPGNQLLLDKSLTIDASSLDNGLTIDANQQSRIMTITRATASPSMVSPSPKAAAPASPAAPS